MSIQCGVTCIDCKAMAPGVGDGGYLGAPVLEPLAKAPGGGEPMPSFGYFYEALSGIGIRPYDLVAHREFMEAHQGHRLHLSGGDDDGVEVKDLHGTLKKQDAEREKRTKSKEFRQASYSISCPKCEQDVSSEPELLQMFDPFTPSPGAVSLFVKRWGRDPDDGWNHRLMGVADPYEPFMEELVEFLKEHRRHKLQVGLTVQQ